MKCEYLLELRTEIRVDRTHFRVGCDGIPERYIGKSIGVFLYLLRRRA